jgi:hypothetical protein
MQTGSNGRRLIRRPLLAVGATVGTLAAAAVFGLPSAGLASASASVSCSAGATGLIAAINAANSSGGGTINLAAGCTYQLSGVDNSDPMTGDNALPVITSQIAINGRGTTIAGDGSARIFRVDAPGGNLTLNGLTLTGGFNTFAGGAIFNNEATLTLNGSVVTANAAPAGGGIASGTNRPGPIGTTTLNNSQVTDNVAFAAGGGGIINHAGTLTLNSSLVSGNTAPGGGGIASGKGNPDSGESLIVLNKSAVDNNTATGGAGGGGGGIVNGGTLVSNNSEIADNTAPGGPGAGLLNHGDSATLNKTTVTGNTAPNDGTDDGIGGGIANANFGLPSTPIVALTLNHSTVTGNSASGGGGGIFNADFGGPATVTLNHTQVSDNDPDNCEPPGTIAGCTG